MQRLAIAFSVGVLTAITANAQTIVIPNGTATTEGSSSTAYPWGRGTAEIRVQYVYDSTNFTGQGITYPIVINNLRVRANGGTTTAGYSYTAATVLMSTCPLDYASASTTFASNHGPDVATVFQGSVTVATPSGGTPNDWYVDIPVQPFVYDPSTGNDLCIDYAHDGTGPSTTAGPAQDSQGTTGLTTRIYNLTDHLATTGSVQQSVGLVVELGFTPASGLYPAFSATPTSGSTGTPVQFSDQSFTSDPNGIQAWLWDFDGDGNPDSAVQNPSFTYTTAGIYDVSLSVVDNLHGLQTITKPAYIEIDRVVASFTSSVVSGTTVLFTDTSIGNPTAWAWDFDNDGTVDDNSQFPAFTYPAIGSYTCSLTVSNAFSSDTIVQNIGIGIIPMPAFNNTYSFITNTRGLWFQSPTRFSITGLRVPDEFGHGQQNVAVYRLPSGTATTGGLEFASIGLPSAQNIPCVVSFDAGEYVGVLGACGDTTMMHNSYGTPNTPYPSTVLGQPTTLYRFLSQTNLVTTNGNAAYQMASSAQLARVEIAVTPCVGIPYGVGSPSTQAQAPILSTTALPFLGSTAELTVENFDSNAIGVIAVGIGRANVPTPIGTVLLNNLAGTAAINGGALMNPGSYTFSFAIPNNPALQGFGPVNWQAASLITGSNEFALSNGNEWWLAQ
jgi:PKD repeat protein